jgi:hypothetical protein
MSVSTLVPILPPVIPPVPVRRFTVDEYHQIIRAGILGEDDNVELLEGESACAYQSGRGHGALIQFVEQPRDSWPRPNPRKAWRTGRS